MIKCNTNYYNTITKEEPYLEIVLLDIIIIVLCSKWCGRCNNKMSLSYSIVKNIIKIIHLHVNV